MRTVPVEVIGQILSFLKLRDLMQYRLTSHEQFQLFATVGVEHHIESLLEALTTDAKCYGHGRSEFHNQRGVAVLPVLQDPQLDRLVYILSSLDPETSSKTKQYIINNLLNRYRIVLWPRNQLSTVVAKGSPFLFPDGAAAAPCAPANCRESLMRQFLRDAYVILARGADQTLDSLGAPIDAGVAQKIAKAIVFEELLSPALDPLALTSGPFDIIMTTHDDPVPVPGTEACVLVLGDEWSTYTRIMQGESELAASVRAQYNTIGINVKEKMPNCKLTPMPGVRVVMTSTEAGGCPAMLDHAGRVEVSSWTATYLANFSSFNAMSGPVGHDCFHTVNMPLVRTINYWSCSWIYLSRFVLEGLTALEDIQPRFLETSEVKEVVLRDLPELKRIGSRFAYKCPKMTKLEMRNLPKLCKIEAGFCYRADALSKLLVDVKGPIKFVAKNSSPLAAYAFAGKQNAHN